MSILSMHALGGTRGLPGMGVDYRQVLFLHNGGTKYGLGRPYILILRLGQILELFTLIALYSAWNVVAYNFVIVSMYVFLYRVSSQVKK